VSSDPICPLPDNKHQIETLKHQFEEGDKEDFMCGYFASRFDSYT
jgi:hypothetical protein